MLDDGWAWKQDRESLKRISRYSPALLGIIIGSSGSISKQYYGVLNDPQGNLLPHHLLKIKEEGNDTDTCFSEGLAS